MIWTLNGESFALGQTLPTQQCAGLDVDMAVCIMRTMKSTDLILEITAAGWVLDRVRGSHHVFNHPHRRGLVVVPHPKKDLGKGLVAAIRRQAKPRS